MSPSTRVRVLLSALAVSTLTFCLVAYDLQFFPVNPSIAPLVDLDLSRVSPPASDQEDTKFSTLAETEQERFSTPSSSENVSLSSSTHSNKLTAAANISRTLSYLNTSLITHDAVLNFLDSSSAHKHAKLASVTRYVVSQSSNSSSTGRHANATSNKLTPEERATRQRLRRLRKMFKRKEHLYQTKQVNCWAVFRRNPQAMQRAKKVASSPRRLKGIPDGHYEQATKNCTTFMRKRGYFTMSLSDEEDAFPIAYSLLVYKDLEMVERLLRAIYRPQNRYCLHIDGSAKPSFFRAASSLASCFHNVHLTSQRVDVRWGEFSVLKPELICMRELWKYPKWKYYINLTGQEFPLKTNLEIVRILKAYRGANDVQGTLK
ncbi:beta-1,3-galactosyl-O-glycosyl-glycoprotein beta-1,6-N-acetylglucosaminyltransferase 3-like [Elysia marginata]|uniref:Beta-1,3-galactosyl-O-glycosyl-glycoprotein beta-1,6-N-acetylglucosaminyltransferase 3-like n=1 Tax=Elysia marginata TaxID=1093978 RepID=A0AAV4FXI4_9GAST|nr:beta-1,3-galactosyl-O-glycosyl-glycoprotein beta-1,6-N-acetylglucosaminyltransferase 3-like [Elysia marginata]